MATVNLGNIKLNWKGAYNAGTAYIVDDVVSYNGSSYVCIQASTGNLPTVTTYWNQMSAKGTDGTDVGTTLTTQGDILYRDGSGLQRLAAGTSGQALITGGSGANPSWGDVGGNLLMTDHDSTTTQQTVNNVDWTDVSGLEFTKTPASTSSKFILMANVMVKMEDNSGMGLRLIRTISGGSATEIYSHADKTSTYINSSASTIDMRNMIAIDYKDSPNTTSSVNYKVQFKADNNIVVQHGNKASSFMIMEVKV